MGFDALPNVGGVFYNDIQSTKNLFQDEKAEIFNYIGESFMKRSGLVQFLNKLGIDLNVN